jgi:tetratricopeptide (TPR) repeat protein
MRRQVNLKACLILLVSAAVLVACTSLLHAVQYRRSAHLLLVQATREEDSGNAAKALDYFRMYLKLAPKDADARERFALLLSRSSSRRMDQENAFYALDRVLLDAPDHHVARRKAVEIALKLGDRPKDILFHLDVLLNQFPDEAGLYELRGLAEEESRHFPQAAESFKEAVRHDPRRIKSYVAWAALLRKRLEDPAEADRVIDRMVADNKNADEAVLARIEYRKEYQGRAALEESRKTLLEMVERLAADNHDVLLLAAEMEQGHENFGAARAYLQRGLDRDPKDFRFHQGMARLELAAGRRDEALRRLRQGLEHLPNDLLSFYTTANLLLDAGAIDETRQLMNKIERDQLTEGILDYLAARIHLSNEEWAPALELLARARDELARPPQLPEILKQAHLLAGECHRRLGNPDQHLAACRAALAVDPTWFPAQLSLASAVQSLGRLEEAARYYAAVAEGPGKVEEACLPAARLWLAVHRRQPKDPQPLRNAAALLKGVSPALAAKAEYRLLRVEWLAAEGKLAKAREEAEQASRDFPGDPSFWVARADLMVLEDRAAAVPDFLARAEQAVGDKAGSIRLALLRHLQGTGKKQGVRDLLARWEKPEAKLPAQEEAAWLRALAAFHLSMGDRPEAGKVLDRLVALTPKDLSPYPMLLDVLAAKPDRERLVDLVAKLRDLEGDDGALWRFAEALRLIRVGGVENRDVRERGRPLLAEVRKRRPSWPPPLVLEGLMDYAEGALGSATERYQQALNLGEGRPVVVRRLVELYTRHRRYADAQRVIRGLQDRGSLGDLGRLATEISLSAREDPRQTLLLARKAVSDQSADYRDHLWLGQVLWALQQPQDAEKELREAVKRGADRPDAWVALVQFLAGHDRRREAEEETARAEKQLGGEAAPLDLAACYEAIGDRARAAEQFKKVLAARPDEPGVLQAVSLFHLRGGELDQAGGDLRKLVQAGRETPALAAWARRTLALSLAAGGGYQRSSEALALLEENRRSQSLAPEDQRVKALVQATRPGGRREAIANLEASFLQVPPAEGERFLLACLHAANREWPRAREQFLHLMTGPGPINPGFLAVFVQQLIQQDELHAAAHWVEELEKREPKELRPVLLRARLLHARKEGPRAVALLRAQAGDGADPARVLAVARLLDQLGYAAEAEPFYRAFADAQGRAKPASLVPLISYLGRQDRLREALDLCEQLRGKIPEETMAPVWIECLRSGRPNAEQARRVEEWVQAARKQQPGAPLFDLALANLRDLQEQPEEAEKIYLDLLQRDAKNLVAANNLAALLALRGEKGAEALEHIQHAIDQGGPRPTLLDTRAMVHMALGQWDQAVKDLEEVVSMEPRPSSYLRLARAHEMARDRRAAREALKKAKGPDGGVKLGDLHPLERPAYEALLRELEGG